MKIISPVNIKERQALDIRSGDTIKVTQKIVEKDKKTGKPKTRLQAFEGLCLSLNHGKEAGATFTLRKTASGVGVERIFPLYSPVIEKIEVTKRSKVRRAKLYHIRKKAAKEIKRAMRNVREVPADSVENSVPLHHSSSEASEPKEEITPPSPLLQQEGGSKNTEIKAEEAELKKDAS